MTTPTLTPPPAAPSLADVLPSLELAREQLTVCRAALLAIHQGYEVWNYVGNALTGVYDALDELKAMGLTPAPSAPVRLLDAVAAWRAEWQTPEPGEAYIRWEKDITLTCNQEGFYLARCGDIFGEVTSNPADALVSLGDKLAFPNLGARIVMDEPGEPLPGRVRVKVTRCSRFGWWYEKHIGESFEVLFKAGELYFVDYPENTNPAMRYYILENDCVPVPPAPETSARERALVEAAREAATRHCTDSEPIACPDDCWYWTLKAALEAYAPDAGD